ncbi:MAG: PBSX family phage terminase large subunit [Lachnospiraceae bacterium]|nr:PBSX family phage terminase large subunit [Lachnospiraceae bacterium]
MKRPAEFKWGKLSRKQKIVLTWWRPKSPFHDYNGIIADGSIRSGKTVSMGFGFVLWAMKTFDRQNFALCGKTIETLRRNVIVTLKRQLRARGYHVIERKSENLIVISKGNRANSFYLFGGKDERSQDFIQGITLAGAFFDEVALMPESFVNQATARCSVDGSKYWFNCNPQGPKHWFYRKWIRRCRKDKLVYLHFTMDDNLTLSQKIKERYETRYKGVFYLRYIKGLWVLAEGIIYDMFSAEKHVLKKDLSTEGEYYVSADYGIQNATVFLLWRRIKGTNKWFCCKEWRYSGREKNKQKTVDELVDGMEKMLDGINPKLIIIDPSATALKAELKKRKYRIKLARNDVLDGIVDVGTMLNNDRLYFSARCKGTIEEFGIYIWDQKAADRGEDKPVKDNDHGMDAVRYFVKTMKLVKKDKKQDEYGSYMMMY